MKQLLIFLLMSGAVLSLRAQTTVTYNVILRSNATTVTMWDGTVLPAFGMAPSLGATATVPAFTIYCNEGDTVVLHARNVSQGEHHTVHLHGLDVDTRNDGDPSTSFWLEHMEDTTYTFIAEHAGTYLYHCHVGDVVHVQMGMYGLVVVRAAGGVNTAWTGGPAFHKVYEWLTAEMDSYWHYNIPFHDPAMDTMHLPPYNPDYFLINGKSEMQLESDTTIAISGQVNQKIYVRLANIGFNDNVFVFPSSLQAQIIDSDGRPLPASFDRDTVVVSPGERYGVMLTPSEETNALVAVHYVDMNTGLDLSVQQIPVVIAGFLNDNTLALDEAQLSVFPHRDNAFATVTWSGFDPTTVRMTDLLGRTVLTETISAGATHLNVPIHQLPEAIYLVTATNGSLSRTVRFKK